MDYIDCFDIGFTESQIIMKKKAIPSAKPKVTSKDVKASAGKPSKSSVKPHRSSVDSRIDDLDQKWSDRFNRLEAILLAKTLDKPEQAFSTVKVTPAHSPPSSSVISTKPFIRPSDAAQGTDVSVTDLASQRQVTDQLLGPDNLQHASDLPGNVQTASKSTSKSSKGKPSTDRQSDLAGTDSPVSQQVPSRSSSAPARRLSTSSMVTDSDLSDRPPVDIFVEEGELSDQEPDATAADPD